MKEVRKYEFERGVLEGGGMEGGTDMARQGGRLKKEGVKVRSWEGGEQPDTSTGCRGWRNSLGEGEVWKELKR